MVGKIRGGCKSLSEKTVLEEQFYDKWLQLGGPDLEKQYQFAKIIKRRWRADFAYLETKTLIEIEGGVWKRGRHVRPIGFIKDCEKYNMATMLGYRVFRLAGPMITDEEVLAAIIEFIECEGGDFWDL